jgi:hypothetical protein
MRKKAACLIIIILLARNVPLQAQYTTTFLHADSIKIQHKVKKNYWRPAVEIIGLNAGVWACDRYIIANDAVYNIDLNTMRRNLQHGFVWDNDQFSTNLLGHPYHGGLYFNAARVNGMNFWQSSPYTFAGSLMWEFFMENEYPSINDFIATPIGGMALGEITFRLSGLLIDSRAAGWNRFGREFLTTLISPMRGLNRILNGEAWKTGNAQEHDSGDEHLTFYIGTGHRALAEDSEFKNRIDNTLFLDLRLFYGNLFSDDHEKPYDAFLVRTSFNFFSGQPVIGSVNVIGQLWGESYASKNKNTTLHWGVFQHFDYYDSNTIFERQRINSYRIAEAAAFGVGGQYAVALNRNIRFGISSYLNGILLGGSITDHYRTINRDYNLGSGFSSKLMAGLFVRNNAGLHAKFEDYRLFTWKGAGDEGRTKLTVLNLSFEYCFKKHYMLSIETSYYSRGSFYNYFPAVEYQTVESKIGIGYLF